jgi:O-acetylserine/cysteine efflux transporter
MLVPVVGLSTAWLVQGEVPNAWEAVGGAVLLLGVAVTTGVLSPRRRPGAGAGQAPAPPGAALTPAR